MKWLVACLVCIVHLTLGVASTATQEAVRSYRSDIYIDTTSTIYSLRPLGLSLIQSRIQALRPSGCVPGGRFIQGGSAYDGFIITHGEFRRFEEWILRRFNQIIDLLLLHGTSETVGGHVDAKREVGFDMEMLLAEGKDVTPGQPLILKDKQHVRNIFSVLFVLFESGSSDLHEASFPVLKEIGRILLEYEDIVLEVRGHTDNIGSREYNMSLSYHRAERVREYLLTSYPSIMSDRIRTMAFGPDEPVADNGSETGRALNRRVDFVVF